MPLIIWQEVRYLGLNFATAVFKQFFNNCFDLEKIWIWTSWRLLKGLCDWPKDQFCAKLLAFWLFEHIEDDQKLIEVVLEDVEVDLRSLMLTKSWCNWQEFSQLICLKTFFSPIVSKIHLQIWGLLGLAWRPVKIDLEIQTEHEASPTHQAQELQITTLANPGIQTNFLPPRPVQS